MIRKEVCFLMGTALVVGLLTGCGEDDRLNTSRDETSETDIVTTITDTDTNTETETNITTEEGILDDLGDAGEEILTDAEDIGEDIITDISDAADDIIDDGNHETTD